MADRKRELGMIVRRFRRLTMAQYALVGLVLSLAAVLFTLPFSGVVASPFLLAPTPTVTPPPLPHARVTRESAAAEVFPGDQIAVTLSPRGVDSFYAVRENFNGLELLSHTADAREEGVFFQLGSEPFKYVLRIPVDAPLGTRYDLSGEFWQDPGEEFMVTPLDSTLTVVEPISAVNRSAESSVISAGEQMTITLTPQGVGEFFAVRENLDGLILLSHDADAFEEGVFFRLGSEPISYTIELPQSADPGTTFAIRGTYWKDPGVEHLVSPNVSEIQAEESVECRADTDGDELISRDEAVEVVAEYLLAQAGWTREDAVTVVTVFLLSTPFSCTN